MTDVILYSGGMDSVLGYEFLTRNFLGYGNTDNLLPLYIDYNGTGCQKEKRLVHNLNHSTKIIDGVLDLAGKEHGHDHILFGRNLYFCLLAAPYTDKYIYLCGIENSRIIDNNAKFYKKASDILSYIKQEEVIVCSPFINSSPLLPFYGMEKKEVVDWYINNGGTLNWLLQNTSSCYYSDTMYCGACSACFSFYCAIYEHLMKERFLKHEYAFKNKGVVKYEYELACFGHHLPIKEKIIKQIAEDMGVV